MQGTILKTSSEIFFFSFWEKQLETGRKKKRINCVFVKQAFFSSSKTPL